MQHKQLGALARTKTLTNSTVSVRVQRFKSPSGVPDGACAEKDRPQNSLIIQNMSVVTNVMLRLFIIMAVSVYNCIKTTKILTYSEAMLGDTAYFIV